MSTDTKASRDIYHEVLDRITGTKQPSHIHVWYMGKCLRCGQDDPWMKDGKWYDAAKKEDYL